MPHCECPELSKIFGYKKTQGYQSLKPKPQLAPQTGPHKEEPLLYPPASEPYDEPYEFTD